MHTYTVYYYPYSSHLYFVRSEANKDDNKNKSNKNENKLLTRSITIRVVYRRSHEDRKIQLAGFSTSPQNSHNERWACLVEISIDR